MREVSVATLSYWQTGRSRPERATSLAAIGPEQVLGVPRGHLRRPSRLPPRGGGAARGSAPGPSDDVLAPDWGAAGRAFAQLGLWPGDGVTRVSIQTGCTWASAAHPAPGTSARPAGDA